MSHSIKNDLNRYIRRWHGVELGKALLKWLILMILSLVALLSLEWQLYLDSSIKTYLFWGELVLLSGSFLLWAGRHLAALSLGYGRLSYVQAAKLIAKDDLLLGDRILNALELEDQGNAGLIAAAIKQKVESLRSTAWTKLVSLKDFKRIAYGSLAIVLLNGLLVLIPETRVALLGGGSRLLAYEESFQPAAPFSFYVEEESLRVKRGEDIEIEIQVSGKQIPQELQATVGNKIYRPKKTGRENWILPLKAVQETVVLQLEAGGFRSKEYQVRVMANPQIEELIFEVVAPSYTAWGRKDTAYNPVLALPEGSKVKWRILGQDLDSARLSAEQALKQNFSLRSNLRYQVDLFSGGGMKPAVLQGAFRLVPDRHPNIQVEIDSADRREGRWQISLELNDDYGISRLERFLVVDQDTVIESLPVSSQEDVVEVMKLGKEAKLWYQVWDNDAVNGAKRSRSEVVFLKRLERSEVKQQEEAARNAQQASSKALQKERKNLESRLEELKSKGGKLKFEDKQKLQEQLRQLEQKKQEREKKEVSLKRSREEDKQATKEEELIKEIQELLAKNENKELRKKLEELKKENQRRLRDEELDQKRLEDLLFQRDLLKLKDEYQQLQKELEEGQTEDAQEKAQELGEELKDLQEKDNMLRSKYEESLAEKQEELEQEAQKSEQSDNESQESKEAQENAAQKAGEMSEELQSLMMEMQEQSMSQSMQSLRRILENLQVLSNGNEEQGLLSTKVEVGDPIQKDMLLTQAKLSKGLGVVKDSLLLLAERTPMLGKKIFVLVDEMEDALWSAQDHIQEQRFAKANDRYLTSMMKANELSLFLDEVKNNMMQMMAQQKPGNQNCQKPGQGKPKPGQQAKKLSDMAKQAAEKGSGKKEGKTGENQGSRGLNGQEMAQLLKEQEQLREALKEAGKEGAQGLPGEDELDELEDALLEQNFREYLERLADIESRLLESEKAELKQDQDEKREAEQGGFKGMREGSPREETLKDLNQMRDRVRRAELRLNPFYLLENEK